MHRHSRSILCLQVLPLNRCAVQGRQCGNGRIQLVERASSEPLQHQHDPHPDCCLDKEPCPAELLLLPRPSRSPHGPDHAKHGILGLLAPHAQDARILLHTLHGLHREHRHCLIRAVQAALQGDSADTSDNSCRLIHRLPLQHAPQEDRNLPQGQLLLLS